MGKKLPKIEPSRANRPRNAFDLSQRHLFTAPAGALLPIMSLDLMPHDHVEIQASDFMRTESMNSAAFMSMRSVYEFFFVPYSQIWHPFDQFITGMNDYKNASLSSFHGGKAPQKIPATKIGDIIQHLETLDKEKNKDIFGFPEKNNFIRLFDLLGYGRPYDTKGKSRSLSSDSPYFEHKVTPLRFAAYQKIYSDYYRNTTYEAVDVSSFNFDDVKDDIAGVDFIKRFGELRYRNAQQDYYTNLRPTPLFSMDTSTIIPQSIPGLDTRSLSENGQTVTFVQGVSSTNNDISVSSIRTAFALDKLLSVTMRAGKTYSEQIRAHFGVEVSEGRDREVLYLGGFDSNIQVGDVTQTSGSGQDSDQYSLAGGYLGKITGKGTASGSGSIKFDAKEHGILMCVYSLVPDMQYDCNRLDPFVFKQNRADFFIPEFENLGMQPLHSITINDDISKGQAFGWQVRYSEYKTALDINHGQFMNGEPRSFWCVARARAADTLDTFSIASLKINPRWLDDVFLVDYNGNETTDCMFGGCQFKIQKVSDMSEDGMPRV